MERIVLIAHDARKRDMLAWVRANKASLSRCELHATRSTGKDVASKTGLEVNLLMHGPEGGDAQVGARVAEKKVDMIIFFWDPLASHPHDVDVKALLRLAVLHDIPIACNRRTADFMVSSPLFAAADRQLGAVGT